MSQSGQSPLPIMFSDTISLSPSRDSFIYPQPSAAACPVLYIVNSLGQIVLSVPCVVGSVSLDNEVLQFWTIKN